MNSAHRTWTIGLRTTEKVPRMRRWRGSNGTLAERARRNEMDICGRVTGAINGFVGLENVNKRCLGAMQMATDRQTGINDPMVGQNDNTRRWAPAEFQALSIVTERNRMMWAGWGPCEWLTQIIT